jgi:hypothetical protein
MEHVDRLRAAGLDTQAFFDALIAIRDDSALPAAHREALYKLIAMECFVWYLEAIRGEPIDRMKAAAEAMKVLEQNDAAIKKKTPGGNAAELLTKDISQKPPGEPKK